MSNYTTSPFTTVGYVYYDAETDTLVRVPAEDYDEGFERDEEAAKAKAEWEAPGPRHLCTECAEYTHHVHGSDPWDLGPAACPTCQAWGSHLVHEGIIGKRSVA